MLLLSLKQDGNKSGGYYDGSTSEMREEDDEDGRQGVAQVTRRRRRMGRPPWWGACCPESWGGNLVIYIFYWSTYLALSSRFFAVANATSFVRSRCAMPPLIFLVLILVALHCCVKIARCPPRQEHRAYDAGLEAIFGIAPHKAPLAAHLPPPPHAPIVILPRPDPLGNEDGPGGE